MTNKKGKLLLTFDYELKTGADNAWGKKRDWGLKDYHKTKKLLKILDEYNVKSTFYCLGNAALKGKLPYHSRRQIRHMVDDGHEIGSHTMNHEYLSFLHENELRKTIRDSKSILEEISEDVVSFSPPFNFPSTWLARGAFSVKEKFVRNGIPKICRILNEEGYKTFRVLYVTLGERIFGKPMSTHPVMLNGIKCIRMSCRGFDYTDAMKAVYEAIKNDTVATIYDHPHCLDETNFIKFLEKLKGKSIEIIRTKEV